MSTSLIDRGATAAEPALDSAVFGELVALAATVDDRFLAGLVDQFMHETEPRLVELRHAYRRGDVPTVRRLAHGIRGSSAQLGGARLAASCFRLERIVTTTDLRGHAVLGEIEADHSELCALLARRVLGGLSSSAE